MKLSSLSFIVTAALVALVAAAPAPAKDVANDKPLGFQSDTATIESSCKHLECYRDYGKCARLCPFNAHECHASCQCRTVMTLHQCRDDCGWTCDVDVSAIDARDSKEVSRNVANIDDDAPLDTKAVNLDASKGSCKHLECYRAFAACAEKCPIWKGELCIKACKCEAGNSSSVCRYECNFPTCGTHPPDTDVATDVPRDSVAMDMLVS